MKLTELKDKIDAALKLHDDYDVKIIAEDFMEYHTFDPDNIGIDEGRFNFNIYVDIKEIIHIYQE